MEIKMHDMDHDVKKKYFTWIHLLKQQLSDLHSRGVSQVFAERIILFCYKIKTVWFNTIIIHEYEHRNK